jgi:Uma2 family endonuclease
MSSRTSNYLDAIEHLPDGATLVLHEFSWEDYERLLEDLRDRPHLRVAYDRGKVEIMSPSLEHEEYARFIDDLVRAIADRFGLNLQKYGSATWKRQRLARGAEPDSCYYVANAHRVIGKRKFDLSTDPPPDIVVEIDISNESLAKFPIYAALLVPEIWRYDGRIVQFYQLAGDQYREVSESPSFPKLQPEMLAVALEQSKADGQTAALAAFRQKWA